MELIFHGNDMDDELALDLIRRLRRPAGDAAEFSSLELIKENGATFVPAFNRGMLELHGEVLGRMASREVELNFDVAEVRRDNLIPRLRRVNDGIAWNGLGCQRHLVKSLCHWKYDLPLLGHANPQAVISWMIANVNPQTHFAVWTDSTTFMGVGDLAVFGPGGEYEAVELKELAGVVYGFKSQADEQTIKEFRKAAHTAKGQSKGDKTADRLARQLNRARLADKLIADDGGEHPFTGNKVALVESSVSERKYGPELEEHIRSAIDGKPSTCLVDGCVWVVAYPKGKVIPQAFLMSAMDVFEPDAEIRDFDEIIERIWGETFSSAQLLAYPVCMPPSCLDIADDCAAALLSGKVVLLSYLDWAAFREEVSLPCGVEFRWTPFEEVIQDKQGKRHSPQSFPIITKRGVPTLETELGTFHIGPPGLFRVLGDLERPSILLNHALADPTEEQLRHWAQRASVD